MMMCPTGARITRKLTGHVPGVAKALRNPSYKPCGTNTFLRTAPLLTSERPGAKSPVLHRFVGGQFSVEGMIPWSRVRERLERARNYWLATVRPDGQPHVVPVWGVWLDEVLYFDGLPTNRWVRNIAANPAIAVHLESGDDVVIIEGMVEVVTTDEELGARVVAVYAAKYDDPFPEPATRGIFRLRPRTARAWTENWEDATRWHFPER